VVTEGKGSIATHCPAVAVPAIEPCAPGELAPLVDWLARKEAPGTTLTFPRGTVLADGRLDLCKQALGPDGATRVLAALRGHPGIRSILFGTGAIGNAGATAVAAALDDGLALETIYLGCNRIDEAGVAALGAAVARSGVDALWLKRNPLGVAGARRIAALVESGAALRVLDLFNCELGDDGVAVVAAALGSPRSRVEHVYLGGNAASGRAAAALGEALAHTRVLRTVHIAASRLGDNGAAALAAGLAHNTSLDELGLASNAIGSAGAAALAGALAGHPRLAVLALGRVTSASALGEAANRLEDDGAIAIAPLVAATRTLRALDLHDNGITSHGAMAILRALEGNASLVALGLHRFVAKTIRRRIRARLAANAVHAPWPPVMPRHVAMIQSVYRAPRHADGSVAHCVGPDARQA
jgi:Ran GTPase-activating protein (RanGAP) involved in mRNA processing and transport